MRRVRLALSTIVVAALVTAGVASAHTIGYGMTIDVFYSEAPNGNDKITGKISQTIPACKANRLVSVYRARRGPDQFFGSDRSGPGGYFAINPGRNAPQGTYYVTVARKDLRRDANHNHYCRGLRTNPFQITP